MSETRKLNNMAVVIREMALRVASDYPEVGDVDTREQLYAIECACLGTAAANEDLHRVVELMRKRLGWSAEQVMRVMELLRRPGIPCLLKEG